MGCSECLLKGNRPVKFAGNQNSEVLFVFDKPNFNQERLSLPSRLRGHDVFIASVIRCPFDSSKLTDGQVGSIGQKCKEYMTTVIETIKPKLIICFGKISFGLLYKKMTLKKARNQFHWSDAHNCHILATYNPHVVSKDPSKQPYLEADITNAARFIENGYQTPRTVEWKEVNTIRPILDGDCYKEGDFYLVGVDTETQGVNWADENSVIISYQVSKSPTEGWTVVLHDESEIGDFKIKIPRGGTKANPDYVEIWVNKVPDYDRKVNELRELLEREDFKKYFFNQKFEQHRFMNLGIMKWNNCCIDARVLAHTIDCNTFKNCSLDDLISYFTPCSSHKGDVSDLEKADMFALLKKDREKFIKYASLDPVLTLQVCLELRKELLKDKKSLNYFVNFAQPIENELLFNMERNGVLINKEAIPELKKKIKAEMELKLFEFKDKCPQKVYEKHKDNFKLTRTVIIQEALFKWKDTKLIKSQKTPEIHDYGFNLDPVEINVKSGTPSTDKKRVMKTILEGGYPKKIKELISVYLEYGELSKLLGNFLKNIETRLDKNNRLHASFSLTFTTSGRVASRSPSLMNLPKHSKTAKYIRELFIPPKDYVLIEKDFAAAEVRFVGQQCQDPELIRVLNSGMDMHSFTAKKVNGLPETYEFKNNKEKKQMRQTAKAITFALLYLAKPSTLQIYAKQNYGVTMSFKKANDFFDMFFSLYPGIKRWHERDTALLCKRGYLRTMFGRKQALPNVFSSDEKTKNQAIRTAINSMIQGPSSDYALLGAYQIMKDTTIDHNKGVLTLFLHDALYFAIHKDYVKEVLPKLKQHMEHAPIEKLFGVKPVVPFLTETTINEKNLAAGYEIQE